MTFNPDNNLPEIESNNTLNMLDELTVEEHGESLKFYLPWKNINKSRMPYGCLYIAAIISAVFTVVIIYSIIKYNHPYIAGIIAAIPTTFVSYFFLTNALSYKYNKTVIEVNREFIKVGYETFTGDFFGRFLRPVVIKICDIVKIYNCENKYTYSDEGYETIIYHFHLEALLKDGNKIIIYRKEHLSDLSGKELILFMERKINKFLSFYQ